MRTSAGGERVERPAGVGLFRGGVARTTRTQTRAVGFGAFMLCVETCEHRGEIVFPILVALNVIALLGLIGLEIASEDEPELM